jgi:hypothetical protein
MHGDANRKQLPNLYKMLIFHEIAQRDCKKLCFKIDLITESERAPQLPFPVRS